MPESFHNPSAPDTSSSFVTPENIVNAINVGFARAENNINSFKSRPPNEEHVQNGRPTIELFTSFELVVWMKLRIWQIGPLDYKLPKQS